MQTTFDRVITGNAKKNIKAETLRELSCDYHLQTSEMVYIGDAVSDVIESRKANVLCLSAAWSCPETEILEAYNSGNVFYSISSISEFLLSQIRNRSF